MVSQVQCLFPKIIRNKYTGELMCVPCGSCSSCRCRKSSLWVARLREESCCHTYTLFGTLTYHDDALPCINPNLVKEELVTEKYVKAYNDSLDYIDSCNYEVPSVNSSDIQKFIKRLRSKIVYYYGTQTNFRYFVVSEYGPTTFRPHYHLLLWFDDPNLAKDIKSYIYASWKHEAGNPTCTDFFRRNKWKFVHGRVEEYVAGYLNMSSNVPAILQQKPFRTWHIQSSNPPIGTIRILKDSLSKILAGDVSQVSLGRPASAKYISVSLWRGLEARYFPKCIGFSRTAFRDRVALYSLPFRLAKGQGFECFEKWVYSKWFSSAGFIQLLHSVIPSAKESDVLSCTEFKSSLRRLYGISRRVLELSNSLGITAEDYIARIEAYYNRKEYIALLRQLEFEESLASSPRKDNDLRYYPQIIDGMFYDNSRCIENYDSIALSFGIFDTSKLFTYKLQNSLAWKNKASFTSKICFDNTKTRVNKSYLHSHPESVLRYRSFLNPYNLIKK